MKPLYSTEEFENSKSNDELPCECYNCGKTFYSSKKEIKRQINKGTNYVKYCSNECQIKNKMKGSYFECKVCFKKIYRKKCEIGKNVFCGNSCSATYNNKHKKYGNKRSKLEIWIEAELSKKYPDLEIKYNDKNSIGSELDIFIPSIKVAFELNGIFHYEPIFGDKKLNQTKLNDKTKLESCHEKKIDLCIINTAEQKKFNQNKSKKYLDIIVDIIKSRLTIS